MLQAVIINGRDRVRPLIALIVFDLEDQGPIRLIAQVNLADPDLRTKIKQKRLDKGLYLGAVVGIGIVEDKDAIGIGRQISPVQFAEAVEVISRILGWIKLRQIQAYP